MSALTSLCGSTQAPFTKISSATCTSSPNTVYLSNRAHWPTVECHPTIVVEIQQ
jgi:hypothetical protein